MKWINIFKICFLGSLLLIGTACSSKEESSARYINLPKAAFLQENSAESSFIMDQCTGIVYPQRDSLFRSRALWLSEVIAKLTNQRLSVYEEGTETGKCIRLVRQFDLPFEGFQVIVSKDSVIVGAGDGSGVFYGVQLLAQSLTLQDKGHILKLPACRIKDYPELHYRGAMLDVSRNFFTSDQIKHFIDMLAVHRLNYFHWHLTDDQGWRIEIKKYPKLTEVGAWRGEGEQKQGGFYTQDEVRDIIHYASLRGITVIPEIDLPGHSSAALAAYPVLGCTEGPYQVAMERGGVHKDVLCLGKDETYQFAKDVLKEVAGLFPAPYIHIGGDEVPRTRWEECPKCQQAIVRYGLKDKKGHSAEDMLQGEFNRQMAEYLKTLGKQMIGWDEILSENIDKETVVMSWRGLPRGIQALKAGHPVIFSSNSHFYLNNYQAEDMENEPAGTGGLVEMQTVYEANWDSADLSADEKKRILGAEVCLWTSFVEDDYSLQYMMLPRLAAFAELSWSGSRRTGYTDFLNRLSDMLYLYDRMGWHFAPHYFKLKAEYVPNQNQKELEVRLSTLEGADIYYTLDGTLPSKSSLRYTAPLRLSQSANLMALAYWPNGLVSDTFKVKVEINKATFCPVKLNTSPSERYRGDGGKVLVDGIRSKAFHTNGLWVGYYNEPMDVIIDLGTKQNCSKVVVSSLTDMGSYIMGIKKLKIWISADGKNFTKVAERTLPEPPVQMEGKRIDNWELSFPSVEACCVKIVAEGFSVLPEWHSGAGETPFLFVDPQIRN